MVSTCSTLLQFVVVQTMYDSGDEAHYQKLLGRDMFSELVQQSRANVDAVHRLVPLWAEGEVSMDWIKDVK